MEYLWQTFLYNPLLNALIALYNGLAGQNLGFAIIELVVLIRIFLLPLTVISERARSRYEAIRPQLDVVYETYKNDPVQRKEVVRKLLARHHIKPWAKAAALTILFLVIVVLYWVFAIAVRENDFTGLYDWNTAPDFLNTDFLGFDLKVGSAVWSGIVAILLYLEIWLDQRKQPGEITRGDLFYRLFFPLIVFFVLFLLPMAKALFILTSMLISAIIGFIRKKVAPPPEMGVGPFKPAITSR